MTEVGGGEAQRHRSNEQLFRQPELVDQPEEVTLTLTLIAVRDHTIQQHRPLRTEAMRCHHPPPFELLEGPGLLFALVLRGCLRKLENVMTISYGRLGLVVHVGNVNCPQLGPQPFTGTPRLKSANPTAVRMIFEISISLACMVDEI